MVLGQRVQEQPSEEILAKAREEHELFLGEGEERPGRRNEIRLESEAAASTITVDYNTAAGVP
eukprot:1636639-Prorocentrum_lima.AAC.1